MLNTNHASAVVIAVVDDEADILELIRLHLARAGYTVLTFLDATAFRRYLAVQIPDLLLLDLMLSDADGLDVCREVKQNPRTAQVPILMVTAKGDELDRVVGLELGADDYILKPFSPRELVARVRARLRRPVATNTPQPKKTNDEMSFADGAFVIDLVQFGVRIDDASVSLTKTELRILSILAGHQGRTWTRDELVKELRGDKTVSSRTIDVHICKLREKIGRFSASVKNVKGVGYRFDISVDHGCIQSSQKGPKVF
ncbi:MAG: response regulator transcription factor [Thermoguttaceae bacterium]|nr:response regulator transcription factor [Thermoguttaceae bacterium]